MKIVAYVEDGVVRTKSFMDDEETVDFDHIVLDEVPSEPIESWYIEDGLLKIDQVKLALFNREQMPTLSPIEFDMVLDKHGLYNDVQSLISTNRSLSIAYNRATFFSRTDPFIESARIALGLTDEQVDSMWKDTSTT